MWSHTGTNISIPTRSHSPVIQNEMTTTAALPEHMDSLPTILNPTTIDINITAAIDVTPSSPPSTVTIILVPERHSSFDYWSVPTQLHSSDVLHLAALWLTMGVQCLTSFLLTKKATLATFVCCLQPSAMTLEECDYLN